MMLPQEDMRQKNSLGREEWNVILWMWIGQWLNWNSKPEVIIFPMLPGSLEDRSILNDWRRQSPSEPLRKTG